VSKLLIPNTTQVPNVFLDKIMPLLSAGPLKVLLAIARFTYGFQRRSDKIGFKQLGKATGLSRRSAIEAVKFLGELIHVKPGGPGKGANEYSLNLDITEAQLLALNQRTKAAGGEAGCTSEAGYTSAIQRKKVVKQAAPFQTKYSKPNNRAELDKPIPDSVPNKRGRKRTQPDPAVFAAFERFWQGYPRRVGRQDALKAWLKLNPSPALTEAIITATARYGDEVRNTEAKYIKHPTTWLNARRWEDEPSSANSHLLDPKSRKETFINA